MNLISEIMEIRKRGEKPLAFVRTYGCQQNVADSEKIKGMLQSSGFDFTDEPENADFILFNTCAVREHAEDRVFGNVGALKNIKRRHPQILIALCGCMMEQEHVANRIYKSFPFVGLVFGTHSLHHFPELMYSSLVNGNRVFERGNDDKKIYEGIPTHRDGTFKGWLPIMYGCNNFCTYCVVPYVRGRERSREKNVIVSEARDMIQSGFKDITLLGQNVNSYGKTLEKPVSFAQLISEIDEIEGDYMLGKGTFDHCKSLNSYAMTDTTLWPSKLEVSVNGKVIGKVDLKDDPADHRGILSWGAQPYVREMREGGSYGELVKIDVPLNGIPAGEILKTGKVKLRFNVPAEDLDGGLAIYGKDFGRYPLDPTIIIKY